MAVTAEQKLDRSASIGYFSMEFGVDASLPIYSGGLGILAGDHLKAASDEGLPLVGVGLFYHHGYFRQELSPEGWQQERYPKIDPKTAGIELIRDETDQPVTVDVVVEDRPVKTQAYLKQVGNIPLLLLTTDVDGNTEEDRMITGHLYGASESWDHQTRVRQEMVLGIGGKAMLDKLGFQIQGHHLNEGHSAFITIAKVEELVEKGLNPEEAVEQVRTTQIFTNHTLVAAGNDIFPGHVIDGQFASHLSRLGQDGFNTLRDRANHLADQPPGSWSQAHFAMKTTASTNAVSRIHSEAARVNWGKPDVDYVTNGVHHSWIDEGIKTLIDPDKKRFERHHADPDYLQRRMEQVDPEEFRRLRNGMRARLTGFANRYTEKPSFDPNVLTIGYARRAASYKRLDLPYTDPDRLLAIIEDADQPVQILMAAKAHPRDTWGKQTIQRLVQITRDPKFREHALFIPDYDSNIAKMLVTGSDVWLNMPKKYEEASGTSGMKSAMNGGMQWSIDDGWMNEVPDKHYYKIDDDHNPAVVAERIYKMLQEEIAPRFYADGRPLADNWTLGALDSMQHVIANFSAARMVREYNTKFYQRLVKTPALVAA